MMQRFKGWIFNRSDFLRLWKLWFGARVRTSKTCCTFRFLLFQFLKKPVVFGFMSESEWTDCYDVVSYSQSILIWEIRYWGALHLPIVVRRDMHKNKALEYSQEGSIASDEELVFPNVRSSQVCLNIVVQYPSRSVPFSAEVLAL